MRVVNRFFVSLLLLGATVWCGCAGYHLGAVKDGSAGEKTIEVLPFNNQTLQPRLGDALTQALRERLQVDGTYQVVTGQPGDLVVSGTIRNYDRQGLGFLDTDSSTPQNFRVDVTVHVVVRNRVTGRAVLDRDVKGHTLVNVGSDLASSERQAAPMLAADVAQNIASLLTEGAW
jgi:hypothetical protein